MYLLWMSNGAEGLHSLRRKKVQRVSTSVSGMIIPMWVSKYYHRCAGQDLLWNFPTAAAAPSPGVFWERSLVLKETVKYNTLSLGPSQRVLVKSWAQLEIELVSRVLARLHGGWCVHKSDITSPSSYYVCKKSTESSCLSSHFVTKIQEKWDFLLSRLSSYQA